MSFYWFGAGHETTMNLIGNGLLALYRNPGQIRLLKTDPSLMANAIEELLRYDSSVQVTGRTTVEDVDQIGGLPLEKGQSVVCLLGSANRDPAIYRDPDRLDITRRDIRLLSFGGESITASALSSPASKPRLPLRRYCAACPTYSSMTSIIQIGGRRLFCVALTSFRPVGSPGKIYIHFLSGTRK
jgi:hypothetical protein